MYIPHKLSEPFPWCHFSIMNNITPQFITSWTFEVTFFFYTVMCALIILPCLGQADLVL